MYVPVKRAYIAMGRLVEVSPCTCRRTGPTSMQWANFRRCHLRRPDKGSVHPDTQLIGASICAWEHNDLRLLPILRTSLQSGASSRQSAKILEVSPCASTRSMLTSRQSANFCRCHRERLHQVGHTSCNRSPFVGVTFYVPTKRRLRPGNQPKFGRCHLVSPVKWAFIHAMG